MGDPHGALTSYIHADQRDLTCDRYSEDGVRICDAYVIGIAGEHSVRDVARDV